MPIGIYKRTQKHKRRISKTMKGKKPYIMTDKIRRRISKARKGMKVSEKTKRKMSKVKKGAKNPRWQGGKSFESYTLDWTESLRRTIRERDHYVCQLCDKPQGDRVHSVHHIDYDKKNCNPKNLITLCVGCNGKVNKNRNYWTNYFQKLRDNN